MNNEEDIGVISQVWRFFTFYKWRKSLAIKRAADNQFTGSAQGIRDAFDLEARRLQRDYETLMGAVSEVEGILISYEQELERLNKREEELLGQREGATSMLELATDEAEKRKAEAAFISYDLEIAAIDERQAELTKDIADRRGQMEVHMLNLTKLQDARRKLPEKKASAVADFVTSQQLIKLNERLQGLTNSVDSGPLDAVQKSVDDMRAKARISSKLAGTDVAMRDERYKLAGRSAAAKDRMNAMLAERAAKRGDGVKTTAAPVKEAATGGASSSGSGRPTLS
jgi:hypothetical protein